MDFKPKYIIYILLRDGIAFKSVTSYLFSTALNRCQCPVNVLMTDMADVDFGLGQDAKKRA